MLQWVLFGVIALLLLGWLVVAWRNWRHTTQFTPEDERYDERVASLNNRQANRLTDEQLTQPINEDDAWELMVRRGQRKNRRSSPRQKRSSRS